MHKWVPNYSSSHLPFHKAHTAIPHPSNWTCQNSEISSQPLNTNDQTTNHIERQSASVERVKRSFVNLLKWFRNGLKWSCFVAINVVNSCINNNCECARDQRHKKNDSFTFAAVIISTTTAEDNPSFWAVVSAFSWLDFVHIYPSSFVFHTAYWKKQQHTQTFIIIAQNCVDKLSYAYTQAHHIFNPYRRPHENHHHIHQPHWHSNLK